MSLPHPTDCSCKCHADPGNKKMEWVNLQADDAPNRRCFSGAALLGFTIPRGFRCRDCGQYYGVQQVTDQLRPIEGNPIVDRHPDYVPGRFAFIQILGWQLLDMVTPSFAPARLKRRIEERVFPKPWEIVTVWTMDH